MTEREPIVFTGADFTDGYLTRLNGCTLVIAHANLTEVAFEDEEDRSDGRNLLRIALAAADDFPELQIGLLDCVAYPETAEQLGVYVSEYGIQCAVLIFTERSEPHCIAASADDTPASFHQWVLGILLGTGGRPTATREDIVVRLAYDLAQFSGPDTTDPQWDDPDIQQTALQAARQALMPLYHAWVPGFDNTDLG
jgi:hypothetical protein